jgi:hypothetical protein
MVPARAPDPHRAGIGLRAPHYRELLARKAAVSFLEVHSENFFGEGGAALATLERYRSEYPVSLHGVGLSLGGADPLDEAHLGKLCALAARIEPALVSEHLCWASIAGRHANDLLPLPYTEQSLAHVVERVGRVQERLGRAILVENVSTYLTYAHSTMPEWIFLAEVAARADCGILLDVNNIYVSAVNHGFAAEEYVDAVPPGRVGQIHLAGHTDRGTHLLDTHDAPVVPEVWRLYRRAVGRLGRVSTLVEWDDHVPDLDDVAAEAERARAAEHEVLGAHARTA